jgi:hypothetical protein
MLSIVVLNGPVMYSNSSEWVWIYGMNVVLVDWNVWRVEKDSIVLPKRRDIIGPAKPDINEPNVANVIIIISKELLKWYKSLNGEMFCGSNSKCLWDDSVDDALSLVLGLFI